MLKRVKLTCNNHLSVQEPFNSHGRITDRFNSSFVVNLASFLLLNIPQWNNELRWRIDTIFFQWLMVGTSTLDMAQIDDFRLKSRSDEKKQNKIMNSMNKIIISNSYSGSMTRVGLGKFIFFCSWNEGLVLSTKSRARVAVDPATF